MVRAQPIESATRIARLGRGIIILGWCIFVTSFFLPATNVLQMPESAPGTPMTGWETMCSLHLFINPFVLLGIGIGEPWALVLLAFPFTNLGALVSLGFLPTADEAGPYLAFAFFLAGILPWFIPPVMLGDRFTGYWLWQGSIFVMAAGWYLAGLDE